MGILRRRKPDQPRSMGARILGIALLSFALIFTALYVLDYSWHEKNMFQELTISSQIVSDLLQHAVEEPMTMGNDAGTTDQFRELSKYPFVRVFLTNQKGDVTYSTLNHTLDENILSLYPSTKLQTTIRKALKEPVDLTEFVTLDQRPFFAEVTTVPNQPSCHHCHGSSRSILGAMVLLHDVSRQRDQLRSFHSQRTLLLLAGVGAMLAALLFYIKHSVVNRIRGIERTAQEIIDGDMDATFQVKGDDELARLASYLTSMVRSRRRAAEELAELNRNLETVVRDRTRELLDRTHELERANQRLRELAHMKTEFLSTVSHELKTPLTSVRGFTNILGKAIRRRLIPRLEAADDPKLHREAVRVQDNLAVLDLEMARLQTLILEVIDMADLTSGKVDWDIQAVDMKKLAEERAAAIRELAMSRGLDVEVVCERPLPTTSTDPGRMGQVLDQLLDNAVKFTEQGGIIVRLAMEDPNVLVEVRDTGQGLPAEEVERIFDQFRQLGDQLTAKPSGTGLGLSICREIVTRLGGRIWAESAPGQGASFFFTLPQTPPDETTKSGARPKPAAE